MPCTPPQQSTLFCDVIPWIATGAACGLKAFSCYTLFVTGGAGLGLVFTPVGSVIGAGAAAVIAAFTCGYSLTTCVINISSGNLTAPGKLAKWALCKPVVASCDPNEIQGPEGYGPDKMVSIHDELPYTILYENDPDFATTAAQRVTIRQPLDEHVNPASIKMGSFGFGPYIFTVPEKKSHFTQTLDLADSIGFNVQVTAGLDIVNREIFWVFQSIDPATGLPPTDPYAGYLPINDSTGKGQGFVTYTIMPVMEAKTGDTIFAKAAIVFDVNAPIATNIASNIIDADNPVSSVIAFSAEVDQYGIITLSMEASDEAGGSGLKPEYQLYYSEDDGPFVLYDSLFKNTTFNFAGTKGRTYCFFTIVSDNTSNKEPLKNRCEATLRLDGSPLPVTWLYFRGVLTGKDVLLNWATASEVNTKMFVIQRSLDGRTFEDIGETQARAGSQAGTYEFVDRKVELLQSKVLFYRLKQVDRDGRSTYSNIERVTLNLNGEYDKTTVKARPNPFRDQLSVVINSLVKASASDKVMIFTADGRLLHQQALPAWESNKAVSLTHLPSLAQGVYLLKVIINGQEFNERIVRY